MELSELRERLAEYLRQNGVEAVADYGTQKRRRGGTAVAVSLRGLESGAVGFRNYLGERFDEVSGQWEERYGRQAALTMGLALYAPTMAELHRGLERLTCALERGSPEGFGEAELTVGEPTYRTEEREYRCDLRARYSFWLETVHREEDTFLNFEVRGEQGV